MELAPSVQRARGGPGPRSARSRIEEQCAILRGPAALAAGNEQLPIAQDGGRVAFARGRERGDYAPRAVAWVKRKHDRNAGGAAVVPSHHKHPIVEGCIACAEQGSCVPTT